MGSILEIAVGESEIRLWDENHVPGGGAASTGSRAFNHPTTIHLKNQYLGTRFWRGDCAQHSLGLWSGQVITVVVSRVTNPTGRVQ
jgi:hypothetical protein